MSALVALSAGSERIVEALLRASLQGALFIAAVWLICRLFPRLPASVRCGLWWAACLKLLVGLVWIEPVRLPLLPAARVAEVQMEGAPAPAANRDSASPRVATRPTAAKPGVTAPGRGEPSRHHPHPPLREALVAAWLAGLLLVTARSARQLHRTRWVLRRAQPLRESRILTAFGELCARLALRRRPELLGSADVKTPQAVGLLRARIVLPHSGLERLSPPELAMTLCHELLHLRRGDLWHGWVPALAARIFFFHPLAAWAAREYAIAREAACDAEVLHVLGTAPQAYGRLLLRWGVAPRETGLAAAGASPSLQNLKRRLQMLQQTSENKRRLSGWWWLAGAAVLAGVIPLQIVAQEPAPEAEPEPVVEVVKAPEVIPAAAPEAVVAPAPPALAAPAVSPAPITAPVPAPLPTPAVAPVPPSASISGGVEGGVPGGIEGGVVDGIEGGVQGGVEGGVRGGVVGGIGGGVPGALATAPAAPAPLSAPSPMPRPALAPSARPPLPARAPQGTPPPSRGPAITPPPKVAPIAQVTPAAAPAAPGPASMRQTPHPAPPAPPKPPSPPSPPSPPKASGFSYHLGADEAWVLLYGDGSNTMSGSGRDIEEARRLRGSSSEELLYFRRDDTAYVVRDPAILAEAAKLWKPVGELGRRQGALGAQQGRLGAKQGELGAKQRALGAQQGALGARQVRSRDDAEDQGLAEQHEELARQQEELGRRQEELGRQQEALGRQQEALGRQQDELGRQQEVASRKAEAAMRDLMDRAIRSGAAQPVK